MHQETRPFSNTLWIVGGRAAGMLVTVGVIGAVARHLGPADFGNFNAILAILAVALPWVTLSLDSLVVKELVRRPGEAGAILGTAVGLHVVGAVTAILAIAWVGRWVLPEHWLLLVGASLSLLFKAGTVVDLWFQSHLASRRSTISRTIVIYLGAAMKLGLVIVEAPLWMFVATIVVEAVLFATGFVIAFRLAPFRTGPWRWRGDLAGRLLRACLPLAFAGLIAGLGGRYDQVLVATELSEHAAGLYLAANRFTEFALFAGAALVASLFPGLSASKPGSDEFQRRMQGLFDALGALGWASAIAFTAGATLLVTIVLGPQYEGAVPPLIARGWAGLFILVAMGRWQATLLLANTWWNFLGAGLTVAVQVVLAPIWIERWGMVGAAYAVGVGAIVGGILTTWLFPPLRPMAAPQWRGLFILLQPRRWSALLHNLKS